MGVQLMCNGAGTLVGFALLDLDPETGAAVYRYQTVDATSTVTSLPAGWRPCCPVGDNAHFHPMYTDGEDASTLVGWVYLRYDNEADSWVQQYVTTGGTTTSTRPSGWVPGACAEPSETGGVGGGTGDVYGVMTWGVQAGNINTGKFYPDWGVPGLTNSARLKRLWVPPPFDIAEYVIAYARLVNVTAPLTATCTLVLRNVTQAVDVATFVFTNGASPDGVLSVFSSVNIASGDADSGDGFRLGVTGVQTENFFGADIELHYRYADSTPS